MGFVSEIWSVLGSLSGGKRKATVADAQHASPAKRSKKSSPTDVPGEEHAKADTAVTQQNATKAPVLPPVVAQQREPLPKPFKPLLKQPHATTAIDRRWRGPSQNAFKQFSNQHISPLAQLKGVNGQQRSKPMQYFAGSALQQHSNSPIIGWTSNTPQQHLRSQPRLHGNSNRYKVNHQQPHQLQQPMTVASYKGAASSIFGPEVAGTPVAATPAIKQRLFEDPLTAGTVTNPYVVQSGPTAQASGAAAAAAGAQAGAGTASQLPDLVFSAALGQEAPRLGLNVRHSPAVHNTGSAAPVIGDSAAYNSNSLLFASTAAAASAPAEDHLQRDIAAAQEKLSKLEKQHKTFISEYRATLSREVNRALAFTSDYQVNPDVPSGMQQLQQRAAEIQQQRLERDATLLQQQRRQPPTIPGFLQEGLKPPSALRPQSPANEQQQQESSEVICIDDDEDDDEGEGSVGQQLDGIEEPDRGEEQEYGNDTEPPTSTDEVEESEEEESEYSQDAAAAAGQLQQLDLQQWQGPPSNWSPSDEEYSRYQEATRQSDNPNEVLARHKGSNIELTRAHFGTLRRGEWLNDEVINMYMALLLDRDRAMRNDPRLHAPKCHFFNTFFLNKLYKDAQEKDRLTAEDAYCYNNVRRWTTPKRLAIAGQASDSVLKLDRIILPVHEGMHWTAAMVDLANKRFVFFDSFHGRNLAAIKALKRWLADEAKDKLKEEWDCLEWPELYPREIPSQTNGCDCGVFSLLFCNRLGAALPFDFQQADLEVDARVKVTCELLSGRLALPEH